MRKLMPLYDRFLETLGICAGLVLAVIAALIALDVLIRNLGVGNFPWLIEVAEYGLYVSTFMAAPWVLHLGGHVRVDVLVTLLPDRAARILDFVINAIGLGICLTLLYYGAKAAQDAHFIGSMIFKELVIPEWALLSVIPVACMLLAFEFLLRLLRIGPESSVSEVDEVLSSERL
ncbi:MAG: TRAP transporter small permease [Proteobacteria bacterium]|nr:MAG: TRAP transporter small permease [Pseudomonadota bacterium]QKK11669.1 MAG: TRAP transporter small permease [Pseudomonadota bacterium]